MRTIYPTNYSLYFPYMQWFSKKDFKILEDRDTGRKNEGQGPCHHKFSVFG